MNKYLVQYTIGPVQSFIQQARKTCDLHAGSHLLSDLMHVAISAYERYCVKAEIKFPGQKIETLPNKLIAVIYTDKPGEACTFAENAVRNHLKETAADVFRKNTTGQNKPEGFDSQINSFIHINWVYLDYANADYCTAYNKLEYLMNAVKNTRKFMQPEEEGARKCSICGDKNALVFNSENGKRPRYIQNDAIYLNRNEIAKNEGLCAICFTKRFYESWKPTDTDMIHRVEDINNTDRQGANNEYELVPEYHSIKSINNYEYSVNAKSTFPSTAEIALMETLYGSVSDSTFHRKVAEYMCMLGKCFDYELFYKENLTKKYFAEYGKGLIEFQKILKKHKELTDYIYEYNSKNPVKMHPEFVRYYAALIFDGDNMGSWINGKNLKSGVHLESFHESLSQRLGEFAETIRNYLCCPRGACVYSGGDDFLGFINLYHLFDVIKYIRQKFNETVAHPMKCFIRDDTGYMTFSAGIVIAYYKHPLSDVLSWIRKTEKQAKHMDEKKDAFGMAVLKHSGSIDMSLYKWNPDNGSSCFDDMELISSELYKKTFSDTFLEKLYSEFYRLIDNKNDYYNENILQVEIGRLVGRSLIEDRTKDKNKRNEMIGTLSDAVFRLYKNARSMYDFLKALNICSFIGRVKSDVY